MTRVQIMSDLHFEFHRDDGRAFVRRLDPSGVDVLVIAGDLTLASRLKDALKLLASRYPHVVYVPGNHEYYRSSPAEVAAVRRTVYEDTDNVDWLDRGRVAIGDADFSGATLWFRQSAETILNRHLLSDFRYISGFEPWVYEECEASRKWFGRTHGGTWSIADEVVVTHHLPSIRSVPERYQGGPTNVFYVCDMEETIHKFRPKLWIHGHTHDSCDYQIGQTRVVCNPYGYEGWALNPDFNHKLVIEV